MKFFITGTAGFIGFHLAKSLLGEGHTVHGYDGLTDYYDIRLKKDRHSILSLNAQFSCTEAMLEDTESLKNAITNAAPEIIIHLAAQAGVRYSNENPKAYVDSNIIGTFNLLEAVRGRQIQHLLLASTSSIYGANSVLPYSEAHKADFQLSFYAATKKAGEAMAHAYSYLHRIPTTVFRFFTVYGPWGRPDMALFKFTKSILSGEPIDVYNNGEMWRDFTYIDDLTKGIVSLTKATPQDETTAVDDTAQSWRNSGLSPVAPYRVVNIGNSTQVKLTDLIIAIEGNLGKKAVCNYREMQKGDVLSTWADCSLLQELTGYRPSTSIEVGVGKFVNWYKDYYSKNIKEKAEVRR